MSFVYQNFTLEQNILLACLPVSINEKHLSDLLRYTPDWNLLFALGKSHGVLPLVYHGLKKYPDNLVPSSIQEQLRELYSACALRSLQLQNELRRLINVLTFNDIAVIPYKGPILANEAYADSFSRSFVDLDLLVPKEQAWLVIQTLQLEGYSLDFELPPERWKGLQKTDNHLALNNYEKNWIVEVHWALFHPIYDIPFDFSGHWEKLKSGQEGRLDHEETLVMLCAHASKHHWSQFKWIVDIDRLIGCGIPIDWDRLITKAKGAKSYKSVLLGLSLSHNLCNTSFAGKVHNRIESDSEIKNLVESVTSCFFSEYTSIHALNEYVFYLKSRDNNVDKFMQILRWLFYPRLADWALFQMGDYCHALYYLQRPLRMIWKWILGPISGLIRQR